MLVENAPVPKDSRVWPEACALRDDGFQVSVICPRESPLYSEAYICLENIHVYRYWVPTISKEYTNYLLEYGFSLIMTFLLSFKVLFRHGFDVIHVANPPDLFFVIGLFYRLLGKKFVFDQHDLTPELFQVKTKGRLKLIYRLLLFLERCTYLTAHMVITTNTSQKQKALERGGCRPDRVCIVRNGPDLQRMKTVTPEPELKGGSRYLLAYLGVMAVQDGIEYALYALHDLVYERNRQDVSLVLMGDGDAAPRLRDLARELKLDAHVNFTGWLANKDFLRYLTVADIGLSPDPQNGLNEYSTMVKIMIYMALGKPIAAFDLAETRISAQGAALYARPNCAKDLANKIEKLLDDEKLRAAMGAVGRKRIEEALNWEYSKEHLLHVYQMLLPKY
jgi:glycosyltransferase involved in cell wall biosynthesis